MKESKPNVFQFYSCPYLSIMVQLLYVCPPPPNSMHGGRRRWPGDAAGHSEWSPRLASPMGDGGARPLEEWQADTAGPSERNHTSCRAKSKTTGGARLERVSSFQQFSQKTLRENLCKRKLKRET